MTLHMQLIGVVALLVVVVYLIYRMYMFSFKVGYNLSQHKDTSELMTALNAMQFSALPEEMRGATMLVAKLLGKDIVPAEPKQEPKNRLGF